MTPATRPIGTGITLAITVGILLVWVGSEWAVVIGIEDAITIVIGVTDVTFTILVGVMSVEDC